jgi:methanethiol S-methyltransferase
MRGDYLLLALLWAAYCAVHSALISTSAARLFKQVFGAHYRYFRLLFNAFSLITLIPLLAYSRAPGFEGPPLLAWSGTWRVVQYGLVLIAAALAFSGARHYSMSEFFGLRQIRRGRSSSGLTHSGSLDTSGILGITRHPWYVAVFILLWASDQNVTSIVVNAVLSAYLVIGTLLEERKLVLDLGDKYREYQAQVSMFLPLKWLHSRKG